MLIEESSILENYKNYYIRFYFARKIYQVIISTPTESYSFHVENGNILWRASHKIILEKYDGLCEFVEIFIKKVYKLTPFV